jgi:phosphoglycolate phosphatase-like HAD superfamily hydrolase
VKYGYIEDHDNPEQWGADLCVDSPQALCKWIRNQL